MHFKCVSNSLIFFIEAIIYYSKILGNELNAYPEKLG